MPVRDKIGLSREYFRVYLGLVGGYFSLTGVLK
jgi:hypothetical protein